MRFAHFCWALPLFPNKLLSIILGKTWKTTAYKIILRVVEYPNTSQTISSVNKNQSTNNKYNQTQTIPNNNELPSIILGKTWKTTAYEIILLGVELWSQIVGGRRWEI